MRLVIFIRRLIMPDEHVDLVRDHLAVRQSLDRRYSFLIGVSQNFASHRLHLHRLLDLLFTNKFYLVYARWCPSLSTFDLMR